MLSLCIFLLILISITNSNRRNYNMDGFGSIIIITVIVQCSHGECWLLE